MKKKEINKLPKKSRKIVKRMQGKIKKLERYVEEMEDLVHEAKWAFSKVDELERTNAAFQIKLNNQLEHLERISKQMQLTESQEKQRWALDRLIIELDAGFGPYHWIPSSCWGEKEALEMALRLNQDYAPKEKWPKMGKINFLVAFELPSYEEDMNKILASWNADTLEDPKEEGSQEEAL